MEIEIFIKNNLDYIVEEFQKNAFIKPRPHETFDEYGERIAYEKIKLISNLKEFCLDLYKDGKKKGVEEFKRDYQDGLFFD